MRKVAIWAMLSCLCTAGVSAITPEFQFDCPTGDIDTCNDQCLSNWVDCVGVCHSGDSTCLGRCGTAYNSCSTTCYYSCEHARDAAAPRTPSTPARPTLIQRILDLSEAAQEDLATGARATEIDNPRSITARQVKVAPAADVVQCAVNFNQAAASCPQGQGAGIAWRVCAQYKGGAALVNCILGKSLAAGTTNLLPEEQGNCTDWQGCWETCDVQNSTYCMSICNNIDPNTHYDERLACQRSCILQGDACAAWCLDNCGHVN